MNGLYDDRRTPGRWDAKAELPLGPGAVRQLARTALGLVPRPIVGAALRYAAARIAALHPELSQRLAPLAGRVILIDVDEFPDALALTVSDPPARIAVRAVPRHRGGSSAALISGSLAAFLALAEGRADGDALFFQRDIRFEGDTEAVLLLRNALDASEIDLVQAALPPLGPLAPVARIVLAVGARLLGSRVRSESPDQKGALGS